MIKFFEYFRSSQEIENICEQYGIKNYTINSDGSIDVEGDVFLCPDIYDDTYDASTLFTKLPLFFGNVRGYFDCDFVGLTTLEGCPKNVGGDFSCVNNNLSTLDGCPKEVGGYFSCSGNDITSLEGMEDSIIYGKIHLNHCDNLYSLDGFPIEFRGIFYCLGTPIELIYDRYIKGAYIEGTNQLAQAIQFFNQLQVIEEGFYGWEINYRKLLEYLKRYKEFGKPTKEEVKELVGNKYILR